MKLCFTGDAPHIFNEISYGDGVTVERAGGYDESLRPSDAIMAGDGVTGATVVLFPGDVLTLPDEHPFLTVGSALLAEVEDDAPPAAPTVTAAQQKKIDAAEKKRAAAEAKHVAAVDAGEHPNPDGPTGAHPEATAESTPSTDDEKE